LGVWEFGSLGVWEFGSLGVWEFGSLGVWGKWISKLKVHFIKKLFKLSNFLNFLNNLNLPPGIELML